MVEYVGYIAERKTEWEKAYASPTKLLPNALEQVDAAVWLIAGARYVQALVALQTGIELLLKSKLAEIHPLLIADRIDSRLLKKFFSHELKKHSGPHSPSPQEFIFDRTISVTEAIARVSEFCPELKQWEMRLNQIRNARNNVTHHSSDDDDQCVNLICTVGLPFLQLFVPRFTEIKLENLIGRNIYHEFEVARQVCEELQRAQIKKYTYALKTVRAAVLHRDVDFAAPVDNEGWRCDEGDRNFHIGRSFRRELAKAWQDHLVEVHCKICGSEYAYAGIGDFDDDNPVAMPPNSIACAQCSLRIEPTDIGLAKAHFGPISQDLIQKSLDTPYW